MPSGSHGSGSIGGGSSHFGGGGGGGSSHFGGRSNGSTRVYRTRIFYVGGRPYRLSSRGNNLSAVCTIFFLMFFMLCFGLFAAFAGNASDIKQIEEDYNKYQHMIVVAKQNGWITTAEVYDYQERSDGSCRILYRLPYTDGDGTLEGWSFYVYNLQEAHALLDTFVPIALDKEKVTNATDSVPMDFENMPIERDGEYVAIKNSKPYLLTFACVFAGLSVVCIVGMVIVRKKFAELVTDNEKENGNAKTTYTEEQLDEDVKKYAGNKEEKKQEYTYCAYCGGKMKITDTKCPSCGARSVEPRR